MYDMEYECWTVKGRDGYNLCEFKTVQDLPIELAMRELEDIINKGTKTITSLYFEGFKLFQVTTSRWAGKIQVNIQECGIMKDHANLKEALALVEKTIKEVGQYESYYANRSNFPLANRR
jgi:hypothetical protein